MSGAGSEAMEVVGQEGLAKDAAAVAQQVSAVEKAMMFQFESLTKGIDSSAEGIRRETAMEADRVNTLLDENRAKSDLLIAGLREEVRLHVERIQCEIDRIEEAGRRELEAYASSSHNEGATLISKYDTIINTLESRLRTEIANVGDVAMERMARFMEVKELHWHEHRETHKQEQQAITVANVNLDARLHALNDVRKQTNDVLSHMMTKDAAEKQVATIEARVDRGEQDSRRRFELSDAKFATLERDMGIELRKEVRPAQDKATGQTAIIAAILAGITILGFIIVVMNLWTSRGGP